VIERSYRDILGCGGASVARTGRLSGEGERGRLTAGR
jgi:hypothetical protein